MPDQTLFPGLSAAVIRSDGADIPYVSGGQGPAVLLLHGFPQTGAMWSKVAARLAERFRVIVPDLRGYGGARVVASTGPDAHSFRAMARDQVALLDHLGIGRAHAVGHDRGGRCAHRLALDRPDRVASLTVMDIVPTHHLLTNLTPQVAAAYYHWFFLAQPWPLPERLIAADPDTFFMSCLTGWGGARPDLFDPAQLAAYRAAWRNPDCIAGMCADYRATLRVDFDLDAADADVAVDCPALVIYGADGAMARHYDIPATWAPRLSDRRDVALPGGHFFVDQSPDKTAHVLETFLVGL